MSTWTLRQVDEVRSWVPGMQDRLTLDPYVRLDDTDLLDELTGRRHKLNESAGSMVQLIGTGTDVRSLVHDYGQRYGLDHTTAARDVQDVRDVLQEHGLLRARRHWPSRLHPTLLWLVLVDLIALRWPLPPARRYPASFFGLLRGVSRSCSTGLIGALALSVTVTALLLLPSSNALFPTPSVGVAVAWGCTPLWLYLAMAIQFAMHELGHILMARRYGAVTYVVVRGLRISVLYQRVGVGQGRAVALAGPTLGVLTALVSAGAALAFSLPGALASMIAVAGLPHLWSFTPWSSDGKALWRST